MESIFSKSVFLESFRVLFRCGKIDGFYFFSIFTHLWALSIMPPGGLVTSNLWEAPKNP